MGTRPYINTRHGQQLRQPLQIPKALGQETVKRYIPAPNAAENMADLLQQTGRAQEAEGLYKQTLLGVETVFGRTSNRYRSVVKVLDALHSASEQDT